MEDCQHWETVGTLNPIAQQSLQELVLGYCDGRWESDARFPNLQKLHLRYLTGVEIPPSVTSLLKATPNLTDFRLSSFYESPIDATSLQTLSNHAAGLEVLELTIQQQGFTPAAVTSPAQRCHNLSTLALVCGDGVNHAAVEAFARHCRQLEGLWLSGTLFAVSLSSLPVVALHCGSRLRFLALRTYCDPAGVKSVTEHCRLLDELQLYECRCFVEDSLLRLVSSLPRLRELLLVDSCVTDQVLIAIAAHQSKLQHLGLHECSGGYSATGAQALIASLTQLQRFCIRSSDISVFTPALRQRWQGLHPGLKIYDRVVQTRYFQQLGW
jgi:hypothetical protein